MVVEHQALKIDPPPTLAGFATWHACILRLIPMVRQSADSSFCCILLVSFLARHYTSVAMELAEPSNPCRRLNCAYVKVW